MPNATASYHDMNILSVRAARIGFADMLGRARHAKSPTIISSHGKPIAALVPIEDLELIEDEIDRRMSAQAKMRSREIASGENKTISHEDLMQEIEKIRKAKPKAKSKASA